MSNFMGKVVGVTILNILKITRAMLINVYIVNTPRCQILILVRKVFCLFQQIFVFEKVISKNKLH